VTVSFAWVWSFQQNESYWVSPGKCGDLEISGVDKLQRTVNSNFFSFLVLGRYSALSSLTSVNRTCSKE
jgi:hypothetical protein